MGFVKSRLGRELSLGKGGSLAIWRAWLAGVAAVDRDNERGDKPWRADAS